jgi:hypothetical protein
MRIEESGLHYAALVHRHGRRACGSVRIQMAQTGAEPQNSLYSASFLNEAIGAVKSARAVGLTVMVSIQDEPHTGEQNPGKPAESHDELGMGRDGSAIRQ